jgi:hypothetical protein
MTQVGSSPPPRGRDEGPQEADSPDEGDDHAAWSGAAGEEGSGRAAPGDEDSGWVAPGGGSGWVAPGAEGPREDLKPRPGEQPGDPLPGSGEAEASSWQGWGPPGTAQAPPAGGEGQGWGPPPQGAWGPPPQSGWGPPPQSGWGPPPQSGWGPPPQPAWSGGPAWGSPGYQTPLSLPKAGSARTGPLPLHPMTLSDVLDGAFRLLRANLATIVLVTAVFFVPLELLSAFLARDLFGGQSVLRVLQDPLLTEQQLGGGLSGFQLGGTIGAWLLGLLITPFVGGAITQVVAASYLGRQLGAGEAIRTTGRRLWALLGASILVHLVELPAFVLCVLPALVAMTFLICTTPAVMIERLGPVRSMRRSFALVRPRFWPVLGIAVVSGLLAIFLTSVLGTPFTLLGQFVGLRWGFILVAIGGIVGRLLASPFVSIVATLVYFDARIRHEGFDLQMIARGLADGEAPAH